MVRGDSIMGISTQWYLDTINQGYMYYDTLVDEVGLFEKVYLRAMQEYDDYIQSINTKMGGIEGLGARLIVQGRAELEREIRVLEKFFGCTNLGSLVQRNGQGNVDYGLLIRAMNEAFAIKDLWKRTLEGLNRNKANTDTFANTSTNAENLIGYYVGKRIDSISEEEMAPIITAVLEGDLGSAEYYFRRVLEKKVEEGTRDWGEALKKQRKGGHEGTDAYASLVEVMERVQKLRADYNATFFSAFGIDAILHKNFKTAYEDLDIGQILSEIQLKAKDWSGQDGIGNQAAGMITEQLARIIAESLNTSSKTMVMSASTSGVHNTDVVYSSNPALEAVISAYREENGRAGNKSDAAKEMMEVYNRMESAMKDDFLAFESTKKYTIKDGFRGFKGTSYGYQSLIELLNDLGIAHGERFVNALISTGQGGLFGTEVRESARQTLALAFADMMFDSYTPLTTATGGDNNIFFFRLSNIIVPLSYLLIKTGEAMQGAETEYKKWISFHFSTAPASWQAHSEKGEGLKSKARWKAQREESVSTFNATITFLGNFKRLLEGDLGAILSA